MSCLTADIAALPVAELAAPDATLFVWITWPQLFDAQQVIQGWGFTYKTCAFSWTKANNRQIDMLREVLESPYAGEIEENVAYARLCVRDSLARGEAPIASHLLYTQPTVLDDDVPTERQWGIDAGLAWLSAADAMVVYTDRGISSGVTAAIAIAERNRCPIEYRTVNKL